MRLRPWVLVLFLAALTGACTVGPDEKTPEIAMPLSYSGAPITPAGTLQSRGDASQVNLNLWWAAFHDPELTSLIERALNGNLGLKAAVSRIRAARAAAIIAGAPGLPQLNADGSANHTHISKNSGLGELANLVGGSGQSSSGFALPGDSMTTYTAGFDASWEIDLFGGLRRTVEAAEAKAEQAVWTRRDGEITLAAEVANDYLALRALQRQIAVAGEDVARQRQTLTLLQARRQFRFVTALDVHEQQARLSSAQAALPDLDAGIGVQFHILGVLLGEQPEALAAELTPPIALPPVPPIVPVGLPSDLLRRRPDIRAAERALAASNAQIGVAVADLYPKFNLTGVFDFISLDLKSLLDVSSRQYGATGTISWPIFEGGQIRANILATEEGNLQALYAYRKAVLGALQDVEDALTRFGDEQAKNRALRETLARTQDAAAVALGQYRAGLTSFAPVLTAQGTVLSVQTLIARSDGALDSDWVSLYKGLGGGWRDNGLEDARAD